MHEHVMPIGPQHPALKEPIFLKLFVDGTTISKAEFNLGYAHRGMEKCIEGKPYDAALHAVQRTCGICSQCHSMAYTRAVETGAKIKITKRVRLQRIIVAELERIHSHLLITGVMLHELGLDTLFMYFWREREYIMEVFDELTGNRIHHSADLVGTTKKTFTKEDLKLAMEKLDAIEDVVKEHTEVIRTHDVISNRTKGKGIVSKAMAKELGLVGPVARASGVKSDIRVLSPYMGYKDVPVKQILMENGDAYERTMIKCKEIFESMRIVRKACEMVSGEDPVPKRKNYMIPNLLCHGRVEAPRGENFHFIEIEANKVKKMKLRTPTLANVLSYSTLLEGVDITDVPVIIASLDPCISCMERVLVLRNGKREIWNSHELTRGKKDV